MNREDIRLNDVSTSKGNWGIFVQSVVEGHGGKIIFVTLIVEQNVDDEHIRSRKLEMSVSASELASSDGHSGILDHIRTWIETTEGDGSLDTAS